MALWDRKHAGNRSSIPRRGNTLSSPSRYNSFWDRLSLLFSNFFTSTLLIRLNIPSLIRYFGLNWQYEVTIRPPPDVLPIPTCDPFIRFWVCLRVLSLTTNKKIFMYITSVLTGLVTSYVETAFYNKLLRER